MKKSCFNNFVAYLFKNSMSAGFFYKKIISIFLVVSLTSQLGACGTILYPERKGQASGQIDAGVAVLDAVGLLFFIVPGVIAFAVDFSNGTIYQPNGKRAKLSAQELRSVIENGKVNIQMVNRVVSEKIGAEMDTAPKNTQVVRLENLPSELSLLARKSVIK